MYKVVLKATSLAHKIVEKVVVDGDVVVDATLGNGNDTLFLSSLTINGMVYSFEVQKSAVDRFNKIIDEEGIKNIKVINDGHQNMDLYIDKKVKAIMFNLGYLPGSDKTITTKSDTTLEAVQKGLKLLVPGGVMTIAVYVGHEEGQREAEDLLKEITELDSKHFSVMNINFINRKNAPFLLVIEKNDSYREDI
ncbi:MULTISPECIES: tRNA (mnm(5)s(2)U34)-methyltransferase [Caloramator]|uniref:Putative rRNA methylase n=1 Tax=Caloramator proteoclasticus DSM 10124 TaxID=1121262 RepID=A0A1M4TCB9_9CLOT|nr:MULTISPECIES: class I SAM-dependent methyltransferase [Caloramator]SHE41998.1 Putative rRNA methylase [Caloramator proteoclasticus DSM 10124]